MFYQANLCGRIDQIWLEMKLYHLLNWTIIYLRRDCWVFLPSLGSLGEKYVVFTIWSWYLLLNYYIAFIV